MMVQGEEKEGRGSGEGDYEGVVGSVTVLNAASKYSTCRSSLVSFSFTCASLNRVDTSKPRVRKMYIKKKVIIACGGDV